MWVNGVVVLHPAIEESKSRSGIRDRADPDIVALEGLHKSLGHAVAFRAFNRGESTRRRIAPANSISPARSCGPRRGLLPARRSITFERATPSVVLTVFTGYLREAA